MTIRGKSALRKKRLKAGPRGLGRRVAVSYSAPDAVWMSLWLGVFFCLGRKFLPEDAHEREVSVALGEVQAVPDHELVRDLEADVTAVNVDLPAGRLRQEGADLERGRLARLEVPQQVGEREPRVDDVFDDEDVPSLDRDVEVLEDAHDARRVDARAVARDGHEVDLARHLDPPHEVGHEEDGALENGD